MRTALHFLSEGRGGGRLGIRLFKVDGGAFWCRRRRPSVGSAFPRFPEVFCSPPLPPPLKGLLLFLGESPLLPLPLSRPPPPPPCFASLIRSHPPHPPLLSVPLPLLFYSFRNLSYAFMSAFFTDQIANFKEIYCNFKFCPTGKIIYFQRA